MANYLLKRIKTSFSFRARNLKERLSWQHLSLRWKLETGIYVQVESRAEWVIYNDIFVENEYDIPIDKSISHFAKTTTDKAQFTFLDIGANVGYFTLRAIDLVRRSRLSNVELQAVLVEGSPTVYETLKSRIEVQILDKEIEKISMIKGLVGELQGEARINESDFHVMNSVLSNKDAKGKLVPYIDLNLVCSQYSVINLVKCDIEGSEEKFIENHKTLLEKTKLAVFEFHPHLCNVPRCFEILREVGFENYTSLRKADEFEVVLFEKQ